MVQAAVHGKPRMGEGVEHGNAVQQVAPEGIHEKAHAHQGHGPAQRPPGDLEADQNAQGAHGRIQRQLRPHAVVDGGVLKDPIPGGHDGDQGQQDVADARHAESELASVDGRGQQSAGHGQPGQQVQWVDAGEGLPGAPRSQQKMKAEVDGRGNAGERQQRIDGELDRVGSRIVQGKRVDQ